MKEKDIQSMLKTLQPQTHLTGVFELKLVVNKTRVSHNVLREHQIEALLQASNGEGMYYKISDTGFSKKPFDFMYLNNVNAYIVIAWYIPHKQNTLYYIDIAEWVSAVKRCSKKSFTEKEIEAMSTAIFDISKLSLTKR